MNYKLNRLNETFGKVRLSLETLADLDKEIDSLCKDIKTPEQAKKAEELCPYFGVIWPAARALADYFAELGPELRGKTVLEVGCGLAIPSIVAAKLGAFVTATDFHPEVKTFLERNAKINQVTIDYQRFDWREINSGLGTFDFVIGSDILYETENREDAIKALLTHCNKDSHIILSDPGRPLFKVCAEDLKAKGFKEETKTKRVKTDSTSDQEQDIFVADFKIAA